MTRERISRQGYNIRTDLAIWNVNQIMEVQLIANLKIGAENPNSPDLGWVGWRANQAGRGPHRNAKITATALCYSFRKEAIREQAPVFACGVSTIVDTHTAS